MTRWLAAMRAGRSRKNGASSAATPSRAIGRVDAARCPPAGTAATILSRAPQLARQAARSPPARGRTGSARPGCRRRRAGGTARRRRAPDRARRAASRTAGRTGLPVSHRLGRELLGAADLGRSWSRSRVTRGARKRLARPSTAFCSWMIVGTLAARRGEHRRHGRIAAEADRRGRLQPPRSAAAPASTPRPSSTAARGERDRRLAVSVAERNDVDLLGGKVAAVGLDAVVGGEMDAPAARGAAPAPAPRPERDDRRCRRRRGGSSPAIRVSAQAGARRRPASAGRERVATRARLGPPARQRQQQPHAEGDRDHRRAAIGDERQRHALGRHQVEIDRHVDDRLDAEEHDQAGGGEAR